MRRPSVSFAGETVIRRLFAASAAAALATTIGSCSGDGSGPGSGTARIEFVGGAIEPILARGERIVIEGFGFDTAPGLVRFTRIGGGFVDGVVADSDWTQFTIATAVPDSAALGFQALLVVTAAGAELISTLHILPRPSFIPDSLTWVSRAAFPGAPAGIALAAAEFPEGSGLRTTLYAAGGAEPAQMIPDSGVYLARTTAGGAGSIGAWTRQRDTSDATRSRVLTAPRAFAAAAVATRFNSRFAGSALYVIGGIDAAGRAQASVLAANVTADSVSARFVSLEPLPTPLAGAIAVVRRGRIYVFGGTDAVGRPQRAVYMARIGLDGHIDGWYVEPLLPGPRAYGGGLARDRRLVAIGGLSDSVPPGGGLVVGTQRLVTGDTAALSPLSGFFTGAWGTGQTLLPEGRSQFALLDLGTSALVVGGMYAGAPTNSAETIAAGVSGDSVGPFSGPVGTNRIADLVCGGQATGTLVSPAGATWREADGTTRGILVGGIDLTTQAGRNCAWGF